MINNLYWIGIRQSEIAMIPNGFLGSVCLFGKAKANHYTFDDERCNQNIPTEAMHNFYLASLSKICKQNPNSKFMFYNQNKAYIYGDNILAHSICCNDKMLLESLTDKINVRKMFSQIVKTIPSIEISFNKTNVIKLPKIFKGYNKLILQRPVSGGGNGTFLFDPENNISIDCDLKENERVLVSPYIENSYSVNTTLIIGAKNYIIFPSSIQIIEQIGNKFLYRGADYIAFSNLNNSIQEKVNQKSEKIAKYLKSIGYRGIVGIDSLVDQANEVHFVELNNRFQASTDLLNIALAEEKISVQELNIVAFEGGILPNVKPKVSLSSYFYYNESNCNFNDLKSKYYTYKRQLSNRELEYSLVSDGFDASSNFTEKCYGFKVNFKKQICKPSPDGHLWINENIRFLEPDLYNYYKTDLLKLKIALLNQGVCLSEAIAENVKAAVYMSIDLNINLNNKRITFNCPYRINFSQFSPFFVDEHYNLSFAGQPLFKIEIDKSGIPVTKKTSSGKQISRIVYMSEDRLRITTMSGCDFKRTNTGCDFCNNSSKCVYFDLLDITESIDYAFALYGNKIRHFLIGGGTDFREKYWDLVESIIKYIHSNKNLPQEITLMVAPFDTSKLERVKELDVNDLSVNIEIYDDAVANSVMKGKGIKRQVYYDFFKSAKAYWQTYGDLRSMVMVGLDKTEDLYKLIRKLTSLGVQPVLSIFRPLPDTPMENTIMPPNDYLESIYYQCLNICNEVNQHYSLGPKCFACKNNVLAI